MLRFIPTFDCRHSGWKHESKAPRTVYLRQGEVEVEPYRAGKIEWREKNKKIIDHEIM